MTISTSNPQVLNESEVLYGTNSGGDAEAIILDVSGNLPVNIKTDSTDTGAVVTNYVIGDPGSLVAVVTQSYEVDLSSFKDGTIRVVVIVDGSTDTFGLASTYYNDVSGSPNTHTPNATLIGAGASATTGVDLPKEDQMCTLTITFASTGTDSHCIYVTGEKA